jgi:hypothetical protein
MTAGIDAVPAGELNMRPPAPGHHDLEQMRFVRW